MPSGHEAGGRGGRDQGGEWARPAPRGPGRGRSEPPVYEGPTYDTGAGFGDATWPGESVRRGGRPRSAIHDPWHEPRRISLPSGLPTGPTLFVAVAAVLLAFLLGRVTGGGEKEVAVRNATTVESTTTTFASRIFHTVQENESLSGIAAQYGLTLNELAIANNIGDTNIVFKGQRLLIPPPTNPTVPTTEASKKKN
jgi:hypothetical protein